MYGSNHGGVLVGALQTIMIMVSFGLDIFLSTVAIGPDVVFVRFGSAIPRMINVSGDDMRGALFTWLRLDTIFIVLAVVARVVIFAVTVRGAVDGGAMTLRVFVAVLVAAVVVVVGVDGECHVAQRGWVASVTRVLGRGRGLWEVEKDR